MKRCSSSDYKQSCEGKFERFAHSRRFHWQGHVQLALSIFFCCVPPHTRRQLIWMLFYILVHLIQIKGRGGGSLEGGVGGRGGIPLNRRMMIRV